MNSATRAIIKSLLEAAAVILLVPQLFVFLYFFWPTVRGVDGWGMMKSLLVLGLSIARVAAPALYLLYLALASINREKRRSFCSFLLCLTTGYALLVAWNLFIYKNFSYLWGTVPIFLCSSGVVIYQLLKDGALLAKPKPELFLASDA